MRKFPPALLLISSARFCGHWKQQPVVVTDFLSQVLIAVKGDKMGLDLSRSRETWWSRWAETHSGGLKSPRCRISGPLVYGTVSGT